MSVQHVPLDWNGRPVEIEVAWIHPELTTAPVMVFLHEGLGSVAMWKDFPQRLCQALGWRGLVYSRPGYGRSTPRPESEAWSPDFMHRQARELLPALLQALGLSGPAVPPLWLFGHSDGGSITLLHAASAGMAVAGAIVLAPHILVEDVSVRSIQAAREAYESGTLRAGLARYHDDPDSAFWGWNHIWLSPDFRNWNITTDLRHIRCPVLAVQGLDDEYGTLEQIRGIARQAPQTQLLELADCGHSPHRDQPERLIAAVQAFVADPVPGLSQPA